MKFWLSLSFEPPETLIEHARNAEALGFEGVLLPEHVVIKEGPRTPHPSGFPLQANEVFTDPLLAFAAMAAVTERLRFLTYVYVVPLRDPFMLAKQFGTLSLLSNDRAVLGTGVGWLKDEFETMGHEFSTRGKRMDEMLTILRDFWDDGYAEFHGQHFDFPKSGMFPKPHKQVPIWIGGHSLLAARRAYKYDGYIPMRGVMGPNDELDDATRAEFDLIDQLRKEEGLTGPFDRMLSLGFELNDAGTARRIEEVFGINNLLVQAYPPNDSSVSLEDKKGLVARFAENVVHKL